MHKGFDSTLDSQTPIVTHGGVFDGEPTCFHPTQDPICSTDGSARRQAVAVRTANTGANGHGVADEVTHTIDQVQGQAIAFKPGQSEAAGGTFVTEEFTPTMQAQNNGSTAVPAVAFKPSYFTRGKDVAPAEVVAPLSADADKGDQDTVIATPIDMRQASRGEKVTNRRSQGSGGPPGHGVGDAGEPAFTVPERGQAVDFTKAKRAQSSADDESLVPGDVAPAQNQFDQFDTRATTVVAFANRTRDGIKVPEVMKDGVAPALTNPGNGGRADAVNIASVMQVRRLCPSECEALQGFPIGYTDVQYRKKPAADGPRYRALGNSMAVPCMWWLGKRIHEATQCD